MQVTIEAMAQPLLSLTTGFLLNGRYLIERELGRGGMGIVYLAHDQQIHNRPVVVKVLLEEAYRDEYIKIKFRQEMEALSRLDHPGIVGLLDTGETKEGVPFLVMQFVEGVSLRSILTASGMDVERAMALIAQIAEALSAAHQRGVLHRDLKPENIMIQSPGPGEKVKIIDFGLAKVFNSQVAQSTKAPNVIGSFSYMAPEQLMAQPVSAASDLYSLGVIAYEMLTGRRPHMPDSMFQLMEMLRAGVKVKPEDLRPSVPPAVSSVVLKSLSYEPANRQASVSQFESDLQQAMHAPVQLASERLNATRLASGGRFVLSRFILLSPAIGALCFFRQRCFRFESLQSFLLHPFLIAPILMWCVFVVLYASGKPAHIFARWTTRQQGYSLLQRW